MIKKISLALVVIILAILAFAATKPNTFSIQRATTVNAPPEKVYALFNDFHNWGSWSPWEKLDPAMKRTFSGATSGRGSVYEWEGNSKVGKGRMEITETTPSSNVTVKLDFLTPFESHNITKFIMQPNGNATNVTWTMSGPNTYLGKLMSVFVSMDHMIGKDFETGLANIKVVAERQ